MFDGIKNQRGSVMQYLLIVLLSLIILTSFTIKLFSLGHWVGGSLIAVLFVLPSLLTIFFSLPIVFTKFQKNVGTDSGEKKDE